MNTHQLLVALLALGIDIKYCELLSVVFFSLSLSQMQLYWSMLVRNSPYPSFKMEMSLQTHFSATEMSWNQNDIKLSNWSKMIQNVSDSSNYK